MRIKKILGAAMLAGVLAVPTAAVAACEPADQGQGADAEQEDERTEPCELEDQHEGDEDCGYYASPGVWVWYYWVVLGQRTTPPPNWKRPKSLASRTKGGPAPAKSSATKPSTGGTTQRSTTSTKSGGSGPRTSGGTRSGRR